MKTSAFAAWLVSTSLILSLTANAAEQAPSESDVRKVEDGWNRAFLTGDTKALDQLLDPDYVSVSASGIPRSKAEIMAAASRFAAQHPNTQVPALPPTSTISIKGDTAVVTHHGDKETSVDVFYYSNGSWHAWYSQHTTRTTTT